MRSLAETQAAFRQAIGSETPSAIAAILVAPHDPLERLAIYRRHFRESFRRHLRGRYPTLEWLIGTPLTIELADTLLRVSPPKAPSLAEYGAELVDVVAEVAPARVPLYAPDVARLDWHLGRIAVAVERQAVAIADLGAVDPERLGDVRLSLQPGLTYLHSAWPVDELVRLRVTETAPDRLSFPEEAVHLELRGARGNFGWRRLSAGEFQFRTLLEAGQPLGVAAEQALGTEPTLDVSAALARLFAEGLVTAVHSPDTETNHD